jgi:hypothetical protein
LRELEEKKTFFPLFLRNNLRIKYLRHCVRFELTKEDTERVGLSNRIPNTYERDQKKKRKKKKFLPKKSSLYLVGLSSETDVANP